MHARPGSRWPCRQSDSAGDRRCRHISLFDLLFDSLWGYQLYPLRPRHPRQFLWRDAQQRPLVPARARCGFGAYFLPNHFEDHWVCEYWNAEQARWILVDAQLDAFQRQMLGITFAPLDVPRDRFITGGHAWQMCRAGQADPDTFGIFDMHGLWFVLGDLIRDFVALNKVEILPWDGWGMMVGPDVALSEDDLRTLDRVAALTVAGNDAFDELRALFEHDSRLRTPAGWQP